MTYFIITFAVFFVISIFGLIAASYEKKDKDQNSSKKTHSKNKSKKINEKDEVFGDYEDLWDGFDKKE